MSIETTTISIAINEPSDTVDISSLQYNLTTSEWWATTNELIKLPNSLRRTVVIATGHATGLEDALRMAGANHVKERERRYEADR